MTQVVEQGEIVQVDVARRVPPAKLPRPLGAGYDDRVPVDETVDSMLSGVDIHLAVEALLHSIAGRIHSHRVDIDSPSGAREFDADRAPILRDPVTARGQPGQELGLVMCIDEHV